MSVATKVDKARALWRHRGRTVQCPVCGWRFDAFAPAWNREGATCWRCGAHERHRALWLFLTRARPELLDGARRLLHFAPEDWFAKRLAKRPGLEYVTADLDPRKGELQLDLVDLDLPGDSFDAILCSHVLEHIPEDRTAMSELHRVLAPGGWVAVMVPLDLERAETYEDFSITDPAERARAFWQEDHVRVYARDIEDRLAGAGFTVEVWQAPDEWRERFGTLRADLVFCCRKG